MTDDLESGKPLYYAEDGMVWKRPISTRMEDGRTGISIGFPICRMHEAVGDDAAETVAELMNRGEAACSKAGEKSAGAEPTAASAIALGLARDRPRAEAMQAVRDVLDERRRQVEAEGWTEEHDDTHVGGEMVIAAINYSAAAVRSVRWGCKVHALPPIRAGFMFGWPWALSWWKPASARRMLVKAAALIIAEIERIDRRDAHEQAA